MATAVRVGRLTVRASQSWIGQDVVARLRAEALLGSVELGPPDLPDRSVLVLRRVTWPGPQLAATARATVGELRRTAVQPARSAALGSAADAVLFADDAELLACLTRDALTGQLTRWYWRQLAAAGPSRLGAVLAAAWTARARWLPAALAALSAQDAARAVSTLTPGEAAAVRQAMLAEFAGSAAPPPGADEAGRAGPASGPGVTAASSGTTAAGGARPTAGDGTGAHGGPPSTGGARPAAPWAAWLRVPESVQPEQEALIGTAIALHARPAAARRPAFAAQAAAWLRAASPPAAAAPAAQLGQRRAAHDAAVTPMTSPDPGAAAAGPAAGIVVPGSGGRGGAGLAPDLHAPARQQAPVTPVPGAAVASVPSAPLATAATVTGGVVSQFASVMYLVNVLCWLDLPAAWPEGAAPGGWTILELLARHLLTAEAAPPDDPLWEVLAELDCRAPGTLAEAGVGADDPVRLPAAWLRRWAPQEASWSWAEARGRMTLASRQHGYVAADVPCTPGHGGTAAAAEFAQLRAAGVSGSLCPAPPLAAPGTAAPGGPPGWSRWRAAVGQFVAWLLASREVPPGALAQPGRIAVTRTHVDVVLDLERVDLAARVCGLDRDPGWVPDLGRIVLFHFEAGG